MTNLIIASCCIFTTLATNWITVSTSWDSCNVPGCTVIHYTKVKQAGFIVTNNTAEVVWNQKTNTFLLESSPPCSADKLTREISINPISPLYSQLDMLPDRKSTRLNSSHIQKSRMPSSA